MKKALHFLGKILLGLLLLIVLLGVDIWATYSIKSSRTLNALGEPALNVDGTPYRDLNKNGTLDPYEDRPSTCGWTICWRK